MVADEEHAIVRWIWEPKGEILSSMTNGTMRLEMRETLTDPWAENKDYKQEMPWVVAQSLARQQQFRVEIAIHD